MIAPHPQKSRNYGPKSLLCMHIVFRVLRVNWKSIKWTRAEPFEMNTKVELLSNFVVDNEYRFVDT